jgi:chemotaxis protein MotC
MISPLRALCLATAIALTAPGASAQGDVSDAPPQPYQILRTLQALQNEAASGSRLAHAAQVKLLREVELPLLRQPAEVWADPRNTRAVVQYVLTGGQPAVLRELLQRGEPAGLPQGLAEGTLAYVTGDAAKARSLLLPLDPTHLHGSLAGPLALIQASLIMGTDQKRALQLLDQARLMSPGSLVEEGALRRTVFLAAEMNEFDRLERATAQYIRRFDRSVYADQFRQAFAVGLVNFDIGRDPERFPQLVATLRAFDRDQQRAVLLIIARDALVNGRFAQARRAAEEVAKLPGASSEQIARAGLYAAAARIAVDRADGALATLKTIDATRLPPAEGEILQTALRVAANIVDAPSRITETSGAPPEPAGIDPGVKRLVAAAERSLRASQDWLDDRSKARKTP